MAVKVRIDRKRNHARLISRLISSAMGCCALLWGLYPDISHADTGLWGAIAVDKDKNVGGSAHNISTAAQAATQAVQDCKDAGGEHCVALLTFHGCAAVVRSFDKFYYGQVPYSPRGSQLAVTKAMNTYHLSRLNFKVLDSTCNLPPRAGDKTHDGDNDDDQ